MKLAGDLFDNGKQRRRGVRLRHRACSRVSLAKGCDWFRHLSEPPSAGREIEWTLRLATADDAVPPLLAVGLGDDRALPLRPAVFVEIDDHPVLSAAQLMGSGGVGIDRGEMPVV